MAAPLIAWASSYGLDASISRHLPHHTMAHQFRVLWPYQTTACGKYRASSAFASLN
ncbi:MAG TPA: hypothetical protein VGP70_18550 [Actinomadura sp.]|jgi:hypothetical protein|nr:hypothetical protein [Actinomadura sp.]